MSSIHVQKDVKDNEGKKDIRETMGERIRDRRNELELTQTKFAEKLADTQQKELIELSEKPEEVPVVSPKRQRTISAWENGNCPITNSDIVSICKVLECDVFYLFGETKNPKCPTKDIDDIVKLTGLSPQAVEFLQKQNNSDIVSSLITNPEFLVLCNIIRQLQDHERLNKIQAELIVKAMKEKIGGKTFPKIDISTTLYSGAKDSLVRILDSFREEE